MESCLAPIDKRLFGDYWVLWYEASNSYSVVDHELKILLDCYLQSDTLEDFAHQLAKEDQSSDALAVAESLKTYLVNCNTPVVASKAPLVVFDPHKRAIVKYYTVEGQTIQIYYDSESVIKLIHPALAHLCADVKPQADLTFDIYVKEGKLHLFKNKQLLTCVAQKDYHLIQGQFIMQLICSIHHKEESDWIGTLHGSTITDGHSSILFVGKSGKGKSTLSALLAANGFDLLADDVSPLLAETQHIHYNPAAISIKEGAFSLIAPLVATFEALPTITFNKTKGAIKYMPCKPPKKHSYPCNAIILVNYTSKAETALEPVSIKTLLETLIPDSWLSPNPSHSKLFLDWLERINLYQLTYSDTASVTETLNKLFSDLKSNS